MGGMRRTAGATTNATDNTHAFTAALLAAHKAGGATVNVPTGIFKFKGSITIPPGTFDQFVPQYGRHYVSLHISNNQ